MLSFDWELCGANVTLFFRPSISPETAEYEGGDEMLSSHESPFTKCNVFGRFPAVPGSSIGMLLSLWFKFATLLYSEETGFSSINSYSHSSFPRHTKIQLSNVWVGIRQIGIYHTRIPYYYNLVLPITRITSPYSKLLVFWNVFDEVAFGEELYFLNPCCRQPRLDDFPSSI